MKEGKETSEHQVTKIAGYWAIASMVLGLLVTVGGSVMESMGNEGGKYIAALGVAVAIAGKIQKTLTDLGYIKSRTDVKTLQNKIETTVTKN